MQPYVEQSFRENKVYSKNKKKYIKMLFLWSIDSRIVSKQSTFDRITLIS
jgi:hypothetical protein